MSVIDQHNDPRHGLLVKIAKDRPDLVPLYKTASTSSSVELPPSSYADPSTRRFPLHSPEQAVLSKLYAEKQASAVDEKVFERIKTALDMYGYDPEEITLGEQEKTASSSASTHYLLPQYQRLGVDSKDDVEPAATQLLNNKRRLKTATMAGASQRLVKTAAAYSMDIDELPLEVYKYAGLTTCDAGELLDWVEARSAACTDVNDRQVFDKIAQVITNQFPQDGIIRDRKTLVKIATSLEEADKQAGLDYLYGRRLRDPMETVFNMDKIAEPVVDLGGQQFPLQKLMAIPPETYEEILGEGVIDAAQDPDGQFNSENFKALLETLPADLKTLLANTIAPHVQ